MKNGVVTVTLSLNIKNFYWDDVGDRAFRIVNNMGGINQADFGVFIMPNTVNFEGALAYADHPGKFSYYKSFVASLPVVQVHEIGKIY